MNLYCFNPDHDICLADGSAHVTPPKMASLFAQQCAWIMAWVYAEGYVFCECPLQETNSRCQAVTKVDGCDIDRVVAWGWDATLRQRCIDRGVNPTILPSVAYIEQIRCWQHRTTAAQAFAEMFKQLSSPLFPEGLRALSSITEVEHRLTVYPNMLLKAPWSGSGQGLRPIKDHLTDNDCGWIANTIRRQRCVMAEPRLEVVQDFAIEYSISMGNVERVGYSLFETHGGAYKSNILLSDEAIRERLAAFVPISLIDDVDCFLQRWFSQHFVSSNNGINYDGPLGVDMLVYRKTDGSYGLHPLVEFNLRHTMGLVAHTLRKQHSEWDGLRFSVEYAPHFDSADDIVALLTPVGEETRYRCVVRE